MTDNLDRLSVDPPRPEPKVIDGGLNPNASFGPEDFALIDDGTVDTVIEAPGGLTHYRYDQETAAEYRDPETGALDFECFVRDLVMPDMEMDPDIWAVI